MDYGKLDDDSPALDNKDSVPALEDVFKALRAKGYASCICCTTLTINYPADPFVVTSDGWVHHPACSLAADYYIQFHRLKRRPAAEAPEAFEWRLTAEAEDHRPVVERCQFAVAAGHMVRPPLTNLMLAAAPVVGLGVKLNGLTERVTEARLFSSMKQAHEMATMFEGASFKPVHSPFMGGSVQWLVGFKHRDDEAVGWKVVAVLRGEVVQMHTAFRKGDNVEVVGGTRKGARGVVSDVGNGNVTVTFAAPGILTPASFAVRDDLPCPIVRLDDE